VKYSGSTKYSANCMMETYKNTNFSCYKW